MNKFFRFLLTGVLLVSLCGNCFAYDAYTKLLAHFDGANGSTPTPAATGQTLTYVGTAQASTAQYKWTSSLLLDGNSDWVTVPSSNDFAMDGDFTVDFWLYCSSVPTNANMFLYDCGAGANLALVYVANTNQKFARIYINGNFYATANGTWLIPTATWCHIAVTRNGTNVRLFQDGVQVGATGTMADVSTAGTFYIGGQSNGTYLVNGYIDEFRISKGIARWTSNFTPPTSPYNGAVGKVIFIYD